MRIDKDIILAKNKSRSQQYQKELMEAITKAYPHYYDLPFPERMQIRDHYRNMLHKETTLCYT